MNKKTEIKEFIVKKIEERSRLLGISFEADEISDDFSLTGTGVFDSMDFMNLITELEDIFGIEMDFSNQDPDYFTTLKGFLDCVNGCFLSK